MHFVGIALEKEHLKTAIIKKDRKKLTVQFLRSLPLHSVDVKQFYNLLPQKTEVVTGLSAQEVFVRKLQLPLREKRKILAALPFQVEGILPFPMEDAILRPFFRPLSAKMTAVTLLSTTTGHLSEHLLKLSAWNIVPDVVSCAPVALKRFVERFFPAQERCFCFYVSEEKILCLLLEKGEISFSQLLKHNESSDSIPLELEKFILFLKQKNAFHPDTPWILTGSFPPELSKCWESVFSGPRLSNPSEEYSSFALSIGLALDRGLNDDLSVQFCQEKFTPEKTIKQRKKQSLIYSAVMLSLMGITALMGHFFTQKKESLLLSQLASYLPKELNQDELKSAGEMERKISAWESSLQKSKGGFPLHSTAPKVSDLLAWLSTHPCLVDENGMQKEGIEVKSLHYQLGKYPKIGEASSPYLAHVELEFVATTPRLAREFHESLLKGDLLVNNKKEIKWQTQGQTYLTSFELNRMVSP